MFVWNCFDVILKCMVRDFFAPFFNLSVDISAQESMTMFVDRHDECLSFDNDFYSV